MFCSACGTASPREGAVFCGRCGAALKGAPQAAPTPPAPESPLGASSVDDTLRFTAPVVPPPPAFPGPPTGPTPSPADPDPAGRHRRGAVVAAVIAGIAVIALGVVGALVLTGGDDTPASDRSRTDHRQADRAAETDDDKDAAGDSAPSASTPAPTTNTAGALPYRCWNGTSAAKLSECGQPTGIRGLRWVFPDAAASGCTRTAGAVRVAEVDCMVTASSGGSVRVHYTEWSDWEDARGEYAGQNVQGAVTRWRGFLRWYITPLRGEWTHKLALLYADSPWSVTVYGTSAADRDEVVNGLELRPAAELAGERAP